MAVTYTATDSTGIVHSRTSARHLKPLYTHAVVRKPGDPTKRYISFHGSLKLASAEHKRELFSVSFGSGERLYPDAELVELTAVVKGKKPATMASAIVEPSISERVVDITPTWAGVLPLLLAALENGTDKARQAAREELRTMAKAADLYNASVAA